MASSAVTILVRHNSEYLDLCVDILAEYSFTSNASVFRLFFLGKFASLRFLFRCFAVLVNFRYPLVSAVHLRFYALKNASADCVFVQLKIVSFAGIFRDTYDFFCTFVDNNLRFYRVFLLFSGIPLPLFFLGRSIGHSITSTKITSMLSSSSNTFLPGSLNLSSLTSVSSTHTIVS